MVVLAAALAELRAGAFAWADCAVRASRVEPAVRARIAGRATGGVVEPLRIRELEPAAPDPHAFARLVVAEAAGGTERSELEEYLGLPEVVQRLVARTDPRPGQGALLISGLQRVPRDRLTRGLVAPATLRAVRRLGLSYLGTYLGVPPPELRVAFDRELHVLATPGRPWAEARVSGVGAGAGTASPEPVPLRQLASDWGLELDPFLRGGPSEGSG